MTHYTVSNSKGSFTTESMEQKEESSSAAPQDTSQVEQIPLRPRQEKHSRTVQ